MARTVLEALKNRYCRIDQRRSTSYEIFFKCGLSFNKEFSRLRFPSDEYYKVVKAVHFDHHTKGCDHHRFGDEWSIRVDRDPTDEKVAKAAYCDKRGRDG